jgi:hypothetical protein
MGEPTQEGIDRAWINGETWEDDETPICPGYEEYIDREPDYEDYMYERVKEARYE